jgi:hypothetical protein
MSGTPTKEDWATALGEFIKAKAGTKHGLVCTVFSYDSATKTCYCEPIDDNYADIQQVKVCPDTGNRVIHSACSRERGAGFLHE